MSDTVSVSNMKVKVTAPDGIVISNYAKSSWATSCDVNMTSAAVLAPTSTDGAATPSWVKSSSRLFDDADAHRGADGYTSLSFGDSDWTAEAANDGSVASKDGINYVLRRNFYVKATGEKAWEKKLVIDKVEASFTTSNATDDTKKKEQDLYKSLRVLFVVGSGQTKDTFIYAPFYTESTEANLSYYFNAAQSTTSAHEQDFDGVCSNTTSIPITDADAVPVTMYLYFEGEDSNCKSSNIAGITLTDISVNANFKVSSDS